MSHCIPAVEDAELLKLSGAYRKMCRGKAHYSRLTAHAMRNVVSVPDKQRHKLRVMRCPFCVGQYVLAVMK
jgi:hypothetical protein